MWTFLSSLPVWVWGALAAAVLMAVFFVCGGAAVVWVMTVIRGGRVHVGKDGIEAETPAEAPEAQK